MPTLGADHQGPCSSPRQDQKQNNKRDKKLCSYSLSHFCNFISLRVSQNINKVARFNVHTMTWTSLHRAPRILQPYLITLFKITGPMAAIYLSNVPSIACCKRWCFKSNAKFVNITQESAKNHMYVLTY